MIYDEINFLNYKIKTFIQIMICIHLKRQRYKIWDLLQFQIGQKFASLSQYIHVPDKVHLFLYNLLIFALPRLESVYYPESKADTSIHDLS